MLVTWVCKWKAKGANVGLVQDRQQGLEVHVIGVWSVPVAPTGVQPHPLTWDIRQRAINRFNMKFHSPQEFIERFIDKHDLSLECKVGRIKLEDVTCLYD